MPVHGDVSSPLAPQISNGPILTFVPRSVPAGSAAGASAGALASTLSGTVSYTVLSGALAVNASTGALTTTGTAPSGGFITARVIADNGTNIVGKTISVPVTATPIVPANALLFASKPLVFGGSTLLY